MSETTQNDNVIISDSNPKNPPIQIFNEKENDQPPVQLFNEKPSESEINLSALITNVAIGTNDILTKIQTFSRVYRDTMLDLKKNYPDKWNTLLDKLKNQYNSASSSIDNVIELIAALEIEYEVALETNEPNTDFTKALFEIKNKKD